MNNQQQQSQDQNKAYEQACRDLKERQAREREQAQKNGFRGW
jgi:hypothetical protein